MGDPQLQLIAAIRAVSAIDLTIAALSILVALGSAVVARNSFKHAMESRHGPDPDAVRANSARRLLMAYFFSILMIGGLILGVVKISSPTAWLGLFDPTAQMVLDRHRSP